MADPTKQTSTPAVAPSGKAEPGVAVAGTGAGSGAGTSAPTPPRTYTQEEWSKREAALDKQVEALRKSSRDETEGLRTQLEALNDQLLDMQQQATLGTLTEQGGDVTLAKKVFDMQKQIAKREKDLQKREAEIRGTEETAARAMKILKAKEFAEQYGFANEEAATLLEAKDLSDMELRALRLALTRSNVNATPGQKLENTPPQGNGVQLDQMPPEKRLAFLIAQEFEKAKK